MKTLVTIIAPRARCTVAAAVFACVLQGPLAWGAPDVDAGLSAKPVVWERAAGGNGHLYQVIRLGTSSSWDSARSAAKALGPGWDLATITSAQENAFVKSLFMSNPAYYLQFTRCPDPDICWSRIGPWIGGFNVTELHTFQWVTGEPVSFTNWGPRTFGPQGREIAFVDKFPWVTSDFAWSTPSIRPVSLIAERPGSPAHASLALKQSIVAGCRSVTATVTIPQPAPLQGLVVKLSDTLAAASSPTTATIPAGEQSTSFTIRTSPVVSSETGTVSVTLGGTTMHQPLTVRPMRLLFLTLSTATVVGGSKVTAIAKLECKAAPGPVTVTLGSSNPAVATTVAESIVVPQGVQVETFDIATSRVAGQTSVSIKATANGLTKSKKLTVTP